MSASECIVVISLGERHLGHGEIHCTQTDTLDSTLIYISSYRARIDLTPSTSYQRLLVHRCSAFYKLSPESDSATKSIIVSPTPESRM
jgi:hypothetical protein